MPVADLLDALRRADLLLEAVELPPLAALAADSRDVVPGALFVAVRGSRTDGHAFVPQAVARGAVAVVVEQRQAVEVPQVLVRDGRRAAIALARAWHGDPAQSLTLIGVTGTNGKTTTTGLVRHLFNADGRAGSIGTLGAFDGAGDEVPSTAGNLTTPGPVDLQATMAALRARGCTHVAMEASSHSLDQGRLDGVPFAAAIYTNFTRDHLDYHGTMEAYLAAKLKLSGLLRSGGVEVVHADEPAWAALAPHAPRVTFGRASGADLRATGLQLDATGSRFRLEGRFGVADVRLPLLGDFNVENALAAAACALGLGEGLAPVAERLQAAPQVPGRMEVVAGHPCAVLRDYAHTPDALERALRTLRPLATGRLIVVFGCGGDRDRGKRPLMGQLAVTLADLPIVTSDNPRTEDPEAILDEIEQGMGAAPRRRITDRRAAIHAALAEARRGDVVLLAGKGHETYQVLGTTKHPFDERRIVRDALGSP
ncbi:MAG: UDP-N-acetylmuramoyl-L-alanyl-D-glutamate--2,6-diaminopimelate ligase [Gemmatimonadales bacterium]|nr:UDP-N-acetylmuramoyl-L-alanyl-D-glutamate--2,6-diaminopimelate ligase [Gemmatimonadales bacterium]